MKHILALIFMTVISVSSVLGQSDIKVDFNYIVIYEWSDTQDDWVVSQGKTSLNSTFQSLMFDGARCFILTFDGKDELITCGVQDYSEKVDTTSWTSTDSKEKSVFYIVTDETVSIVRIDQEVMITLLN